MSVDINTYIQNEEMRNIFSKSFKIMKDELDVDVFIVNDIYLNSSYNLLFEYPSLKNYFYSKLDEYGFNYKYVNCNSSLERFFNDIDPDKLNIFNNINACNDKDIIKIIKNTPGILIC